MSRRHTEIVLANFKDISSGPYASPTKIAVICPFCNQLKFLTSKYQITKHTCVPTNDTRTSEPSASELLNQSFATSASKQILDDNTRHPMYNNESEEFTSLFQPTDPNECALNSQDYDLDVDEETIDRLYNYE
jgi:hypothetical protein